MNLQFEIDEKKLVLVAEGNFRHYDGLQFDEIKKILPKIEEIDFNTDSLKTWDSSLVAVIFGIVEEAKKTGVKVNTNKLPTNLRRLLELALEVDRKPEVKNEKYKESWLEKFGDKGIFLTENVNAGLAFLNEALLSLGRFFTHRAVMRKVDFEFALENCTYKAVGIVSLVSFMVGLILAFVGAIQLKMFDAQIYVASLVTIGMIRIMGAIMAGIIMAGRTGASYAALIGTMQVNEEVDALKTFGFPVFDFLVLPRMLSLVVAMPFLTMLADIMGMLGGAFVAVLALDISAAQYLQFSIDAFGLTNFLVGIFHGFVYGIIISCCGCYYGINCGRKAESVGLATTNAVVSAIVIMIVVTGILTLICQVLKI